MDYQSRQDEIEKYGAERFAIGEKYGHAIWEYLNVHAETPGDHLPGVLLRAQELLKDKCSVQDAIDQADAELNSLKTDDLLSKETIAELLINWPPKDRPFGLGNRHYCLNRLEEEQDSGIKTVARDDVSRRKAYTHHR